MKKLFVFLLFVSLSGPVLSWSGEGHVLIVDLAVENLSPAKARELETIARQLERSFDTDRRLYLLNTYRNASDLAKISIFPDRIRGASLGELFEQRGLAIPLPLAQYANADTSQWHYTNQPYFSGASEAPQCNIASDTNVVSVLPPLMESYKLAEDDMSRAILLAFIIHFVSDTHQPLHTISRVDQFCEHDLGGNAFCATQRGFGDRCDMNLHALWDGAVGLFDRFDTYDTLHQAFAGRNADPDLAEELDTDRWLRESYQHARFIYTLREDQNPDDIYIADGQHIAFTQIVLAADRLGKILEEL